MTQIELTDGWLIEDLVEEFLMEQGPPEPGVKAQVRVRPYVREGHPVAGYVRDIANFNGDDASAIFDGFSFGGLTAKVQHVGRDSFGISVSGQIYRGDKPVGGFARVFHLGTVNYHMQPTGVVEHHTLKLNPDEQGAGFASAFNRHAEEQYRQWGFRQIKVQAVNVGGYAWARAGYRFAYDDPADEIAALVHEKLGYDPVGGEERPPIQEGFLPVFRPMLRGAAEAADAAFRAALPFDFEHGGPIRDTPAGHRRAGHLTSEFEIARFGYDNPDWHWVNEDGHDMWPGKWLMLGNAWSGVKDLVPPAGEKALTWDEQQRVGEIYDDWCREKEQADDDPGFPGEGGNLFFADDAGFWERAASDQMLGAKGRVHVRPYIRDGQPVAGYIREQDLAARVISEVGDLIRGVSNRGGKGRKGLKRPRQGWLDYARREHEMSVPIQQRRLMETYHENASHGYDTPFFNEWWGGPGRQGRYQTISGDPGYEFEAQHERIMEVGARLDAELSHRISAQEKAHRDGLKREKALHRELKKIERESEQIRLQAAADILERDKGWLPLTPQQVKKRLAAFNREKVKQVDVRDPAFWANFDVAMAYGTAGNDPRIAELRRQRNEVQDRLITAVSDNIGLYKEMVDARAGAAYDMLSQIRPFGTVRLNYRAEDQAASAAIFAAHFFLPADWIDASNKHVNQLVVSWTGERGRYFHTFSRDMQGGVVRSGILVSPGLTPAGPGRARGAGVALHELVHRSEYVRDGITGAEWTFYTSRVSPYRNARWQDTESLREITGSRAYDEGEKTRPDDFTNVYSGKTYGDEMNSTYEILSMGIEDLLTGGSHVLDGDEEFRQFVLGSLALL